MHARWPPAATIWHPQNHLTLSVLVNGLSGSADSKALSLLRGSMSSQRRGKSMLCCTPWGTRPTAYSKRLHYQTRTIKSTKQSKRSSIQSKNIIYECAVFNRRKQEKGESVWATSLPHYIRWWNIAITVIYAKKMICNRILVEIRYSTLSLRLQLNEKLTLDDTVTQAREAELIKEQQPLRGEQKEATNSTASVSTEQKRRRQDHGPRMKKGPGCKRATRGQACTRCIRSP